MAGGRFELRWRGAETRAQVVGALVAGLAEVGLRVEAEAKRELTPGRGVLTGTLRRSIHSASPSYNFAGDNVTPAANAPERGGTGGQPEEVQGRIVVSIGSGMVYARYIEGLYGYMMAGLTRVAPTVIDVLKKHGAAAGLG